MNKYVPVIMSPWSALTKHLLWYRTKFRSRNMIVSLCHLTGISAAVLPETYVKFQIDLIEWEFLFALWRISTGRVYYGRVIK